MKLVCYGASVTAQKDKSGYFFYLQNLLEKHGFSVIERLSFGASHFDYAGFGYSRLLIDLKPDICLIDWLTPSMKEFTTDKIVKLNNELIINGAIPIWVNFPRKDDLNNERKCFQQVKNACHDASIEFWDFCEMVNGVKEHPEKFIRDVVHTNEIGALSYAEVLACNLIKDRHIPKLTDTPIKKLPLVYSFERKINIGEMVCVDIKLSQETLVEVLLEAIIGPAVCLFELEIIEKHTGNIVLKKEVNPADPWCYYERTMVLPPIKAQCDKGDYTLGILAVDGDPLSSIELRQPINRESFERSIQFNRIAVNADYFEITEGKY